MRAGLPQQLWSFPSWQRVEVPPGRWSQEVSPPPLPPSPVSPGGSSHLLPLSLLGRKGGRDGQLVPRGHQCRGRCPTGAGCWPLPPRARLHRSARPGPPRLGPARLGRAPRVAIGCGGRGGAGPRPCRAAAAESCPARPGFNRRRRRSGPRQAGPGRAAGHPATAPAAAGRMIGVNSINSSAGRMRSRSMCSVRYGRNYRGVETFCYGWPQRSRTLKPVLYTDLVVSRLQSRRKKKPVSGGAGGAGGAAGGCAVPCAPAGTRAGGRADGRTRPDSGRPARRPARPLREPQPWRGCSEQPAPSPSPACFLRSRVPIRPPPPEGPPLRPCHSPPIPPRARG